jgi:hypothetical protein
MKIAFLAVTAALLAGCSAERPEWRAEPVPAIVVPAAAISAAKPPRPCPPLDPVIGAEAKRLTPIGQAKDVDALTAALMGSEAAKNARLAMLTRAYERCRKAHN